ncbi:hypothetical protein D3C73_1070960 [compost metagenome]
MTREENMLVAQTHSRSSHSALSQHTNHASSCCNALESAVHKACKPRTVGLTRWLRNLLKARFKTLKKPSSEQDRSKMPERTECAEDSAV